MEKRKHMKIVDSDIRLQQNMGVPKLETPSRARRIRKGFGRGSSLNKGELRHGNGMAGADLFQAQPITDPYLRRSRDSSSPEAPKMTWKLIDVDGMLAQGPLLRRGVCDQTSKSRTRELGWAL